METWAWFNKIFFLFSNCCLFLEDDADTDDFKDAARAKAFSFSFSMPANHKSFAVFACVNLHSEKKKRKNVSQYASNSQTTCKPLANHSQTTRKPLVSSTTCGTYLCRINPFFSSLATTTWFPLLLRDKCCDKYKWPKGRVG